MSRSNPFFVAVFALVVLASVHAFSASSMATRYQATTTATALQSSAANNRDDFSSFAASLDESTVVNNPQSVERTWKDDLEELLEPSTSTARRQILMSSLLSANSEIRESVQKAIQDRNIDPLLTARGQRLQDNSRAVARQITSDILPFVASQAREVFFQPPDRVAATLNKQLNQVFNMITSATSDSSSSNSNNMRNALFDSVTSTNPAELLQTLPKQASDLVQDVFSETPVGLQEPPYTVVKTTPFYEIRDYSPYTVISTSVTSKTSITDTTTTIDDNDYNVDDVAQQGAAFNTLASYIFGGNKERERFAMTTPVATTYTGEMRFYVNSAALPQPMPGSSINIQELPAARLAVRRFGGFVTAGEVKRQKQILLSQLAMDSDSVALDVPHGSAVGHLIFQYNPPYTFPVVRRNEIAVPVVLVGDEN